MDTITKILASVSASAEIRIISGEGDVGTTEQYTGARTVSAIQTRMSRERCGGQRWVRAVVYSHSNSMGGVGIDLQSGEYVAWAA